MPSQFTKLIVNINDSSIDYKPENIASRIVFVVENVKVFIVCLGIQLCLAVEITSSFCRFQAV